MEPPPLERWSPPVPSNSGGGAPAPEPSATAAAWRACVAAACVAADIGLGPLGFLLALGIGAPFGMCVRPTLELGFGFGGRGSGIDLLIWPLLSCAAMCDCTSLDWT